MKFYKLGNKTFEKDFRNISSQSTNQRDSKNHFLADFMASVALGHFEIFLIFFNFDQLFYIQAS